MLWRQLAAADQLAWYRARIGHVGLADCLHEASRLEHLHLRCPDVFDRLEYLERVAAGWHSLAKISAVPAPFLELLSHFWTRPFSELRREVTDVLAAVAAEPDAWLAHLHRVAAQSPQLLALFGRVLDAYEWTLNPVADGRDPAELAVLARHFLEEHGGLGFPELRPRLLAFCLREQVPPDLLADDWPLRHVYRACTLFWN
jgi:hypothetical protein